MQIMFILTQLKYSLFLLSIFTSNNGHLYLRYCFMENKHQEYLSIMSHQIHFVTTLLSYYNFFLYLPGTPPPGASTAKPGTPANLQARKCTFEASNICRYTQDRTDDFQWSRDTSGTATQNTGPRTDHTYGTRQGRPSVTWKGYCKFHRFLHYENTPM